MLEDSKQRSYWRRRIQRHLILALVSGILMLLIFHTLPSTRNVVFRLSMASAYAGLTFLGLSLIIGPWNVLQDRPNPISTDLRRDVGIWAGLLGLVHMIVGLQVHMGGKFWLYFLYPPNQSHFLPLRHDAFGFANFMGLVATLILILLLSLSNDFSLRALGVKRWKALQRWNYVGFAGTVVHGAVYQFIEERKLFFVGLFGGMVLMVIISQLAGFQKIRRQLDQGNRIGKTLNQ
ncbi:MAG TPA: hypothetical protein VNM22_17815 [Candidatus Limnocylindrales bacterium]|nr:hypothetical protein [Candidatus Limnocylindrales bacterium]